MLANREIKERQIGQSKERLQSNSCFPHISEPILVALEQRLELTFIDNRCAHNMLLPLEMETTYWISKTLDL